MTNQEIHDMITDLQEVRREITRVNRAAGQTAFNPSATEAVEGMLETMREELGIDT
jgi:hypothetical protein